MVICVPSGITGVEQRAVMEAAEYAGTAQGLHHRRANGGGGRWSRAATGWRTDGEHGGQHRKCAVSEVAVISLGGSSQPVGPQRRR